MFLLMIVSADSDDGEASPTLAKLIVDSSCDHDSDIEYWRCLLRCGSSAKISAYL